MADLGDRRVTAIVQARTSSSRLPGKVLEPILGRPMLERVIERVGLCSLVDRIVVATSTDRSDDAIENLCYTLDVPYYRGELHDVLSRYYMAAKHVGASTIVRVTADCPLLDPDTTDETIRLHTSAVYDYTSNCVPPSFPDGLDVEVFPFEVLERAFREAREPAEREHVTLYINQKPEFFRIGTHRAKIDRSDMRWTVDHARDLQFVRKIYEKLYPGNREFSYKDVLELLRVEPDLAKMNGGIARNETLRSLDHKSDRKASWGN